MARETLNRSILLLPAMFFYSMTIKIEAAPCPRPCTCPDTQNLTVNCSGQLLKTPPVTSRSTVTLDLSHNGLGPIINDSFPQMANLTSLDLSHNSLQRLLGCTLSGMIKLTTVRLSGNRLTSLPDSLFTDADQVQHLDLSHNLFTQLPSDILRYLTKLKTLDFSNNLLLQLTLGNRFQVPRYLQVMDFSYNQITNIAADAFQTASQWDNLINRTVNLAYCRISQIDHTAFSKIPNLHELHLSGNSAISIETIAALMKELEKSGGLERLSLAHMNVSTIMTVFPNLTLTALKFLNVSFNNINDVPADAFSTISSLCVLDISHNSLTQLSQGFGKLKNLQVLNISHNQLATFHDASAERLLQPQVLDVSHNKLAEPSKVQFSTLTKLTHLDVSNNLLTSAVFPSKTSNLNYIDYHCNRISQFSGLDDATQLETFDISDNDLTVVGFHLFKGGKFIKLANFSKNSIASLDPKAFLPHSPLVIDLSHNFLSELHYSNWVATQKLFLNHNRLSNINVQAFYGMTGLHVLDLSQNNLTSLQENVFEYLTGLRYLNLSHNALNQVLWFHLFRNLEFLETLDIGYNSLTEMSEVMLLPLHRIHQLSLRNNRLNTIIPLVFRDLATIKLLDLSHNPFHCGCDMLAFRDWLRRTTIPVPGLYSPNSTAYQCQSPYFRQGVHVTKWEAGEFECNKTMLYVTIFGSLGLIFMILGVSGSAAYRLFKKWRHKREEKLRIKREMEALWKDAKKADHVRMSSQDIAFEIREAAAKRKDGRAHREQEGEDRSNSYAPWPGEAHRLKEQDRSRRRGDGSRAMEEDTLRDRLKEQDRSRRRGDGSRAMEEDKTERSKRGRPNHDRSQAEELTDETTMKRPRADIQERSYRYGHESAEEHGNLRRQEFDPRRERDFVLTVPLHIVTDRYGFPTVRKALTNDHYTRDRRASRDHDRDVYLGKDSRYRYPADASRRSGPFIISPAAHTLPKRWDGVGAWRGGPRIWTMEDYARFESQGPKVDGYMSMPVGAREIARHEQEHGRGEDFNIPGRFPPEVHFQAREHRRGHPGQHSDDADYGHHYRRRSQSYHHLPRDYADERPVGKMDRAQRQYESIEQTRKDPAVGQRQRAASQPYLANESTSDWL